MNKAVAFLKELVVSREFLTGILIGGGIMSVAYGVSWLVN